MFTVDNDTYALDEEHTIEFRVLGRKVYTVDENGDKTEAKVEVQGGRPVQGGIAFWLALGGALLAAYLYTIRVDLPKRIAIAFGPLYALVERKYGFDEL